jgi:hydroxyacyl-ACP dehydratase HTD2-like protein with hotdog domain
VSLLASAVDGWSPGPVTDTAVVAPGPAAAFAALLDRPAPPLADGDPLPPGRHAFTFLDRPATADLGEDGHPGPVVHGPLLALLLLEVVRRHAPDRSVTSAGHRLTRPAYAGTPVRATGRFDGDRVELTAGAVGSPASATGTVTPEPTP